MFEETQPITISHGKHSVTLNPGLFINNKFVKSQSKKMLSTVNPATGEEICKVYEGDKTDVDLAVSAAAKAYEIWSKFSCI